MTATKRTYSSLGTEDKARLIASWIVDKQGEDVIALDLRGKKMATEAVIIATARGVRHCQALADHLLGSCGRDNLEFLGMEGYQAGQWILLDMNDVVAHLFLEEVRMHYNLEGLWADAAALFRQAPAMTRADGRDAEGASR